MTDVRQLSIPAGRLFFSVAEVATLMDVDPRTVRRGIEAGDIPAVRVGPSTVRIPAPTFLRDVAGLTDAELERLGFLNTDETTDPRPLRPKGSAA